MNINNYAGNYSQPRFKAQLKTNANVKELLNHIDEEDKKELTSAIKNLTRVAPNEVIELRKTAENNTEIYSLVNTKNDRNSVFLCRMFPRVTSEGESTLRHKKHFSKMEYLKETLIETLKLASLKHSETFHSLFTEEKDRVNRLKKYYI